MRRLSTFLQHTPSLFERIVRARDNYVEIIVDFLSLN